jgi:hypothetical protein
LAIQLASQIFCMAWVRKSIASVFFSIAIVVVTHNVYGLVVIDHYPMALALLYAQVVICAAYALFCQDMGFGSGHYTPI